MLPLTVWTVEPSQTAIGVHWYLVLNYVIACYDANKYKSPEAWLDANAPLLSRHITIPMYQAAFSRPA